MTQKLYCYVDETGQDTKGKLFIVVAIVVAREHDILVKKLEKIERQTRKRKIKWFKTKTDIKKEYLDSVSAVKELNNKIYFQSFADSKIYRDLTCLVIAKAIHRYRENQKIENYKATIFIDGLEKSQTGKISKALRDLDIKIRKVRGIRDESNALIRLADAVAGSLRKAKGANQIRKILIRLN